MTMTANIDDTDKKIGVYVRCIIRGAVSYVVLFHPMLAPNSILFIQSFQSMGWPLIKNNVKVLWNALLKSKTAIEEAVPSVQEQISKITALEKELEEIYQKMKTEKVDLTAFKKKEVQLKQDIMKFQNIVEDSNIIFKKVKSEIDFHLIQDICTQFLAATISCKTIATSPVLSTFSIGVNIGERISQTLNHLIDYYTDKYISNNPSDIPIQTVSEVAPENRCGGRFESDNGNTNSSQALMITSAIGITTGILTAYWTKHFSQIIGSCSLGAHLLTSNIDEIVMSTFLSNPTTTTTTSVSSIQTRKNVLLGLEGALLVLGLFHVLRPQRTDGATPPSVGIVRVLLSPVLLFEALLTKQLK